MRSLSTHVMNIHKAARPVPATKARTIVKNPPKVTPKRQTRAKTSKLENGDAEENAEQLEYDEEESGDVEKVAEHTCSICNTVFLTSKRLKLHLRMHNPIKMQTLEKAAEHELNTISNNEETLRERFYCGICDKL